MASSFLNDLLAWLGLAEAPPAPQAAPPAAPEPAPAPQEEPAPIPEPLLSAGPHLPPFLAARPPNVLRLAVDLSNLRPGGENGGIKPFLYETLRFLGRQRRVEIEFIYLTSSLTHADVREDLARWQDQLVCVRANGGEPPTGTEHAPREWLAAPPPPDLLWRFGAQVLYCPFGQAEFATAGIGTVCTIVDVLHRDFPWSLTPEHNAERERVFQEILAVADRLQCNSEHVIGRMQAHYQVPRARMFTVYNAVHQRFAALPAASSHAGTDGAAAAPFFFYPANSWKHKNHESLLLAYGLYRHAALARGETPWTLLLTGHEDERWAEVRALTRTLGLAGDDAVRFAGYVPAEAFGSLWETAGALVFPSLHEGFGIPLLEAMQHGVPVLCSRDGSLPEVGADACLYADARRPESLAEGLTRLATDPALRRRLVEAGRRRLADFSEEREVGRLLDALLELAGNPPPYHPQIRGVFPDGWTEGAVLCALPAGPTADATAELTVRVAPLPAARRLRLRVGPTLALGSFALPADQPEREITVRFRSDGAPLFLEVPDAANLNAADPRQHGVQLVSAALRFGDGARYDLFPPAAPR